MVGSVKVRHGTTVSDGGIIRHNDIPISWLDADNRAGFRLDRRKSWCFITNDQGLPDLCEAISWSSACSGCTEVPEMKELSLHGLIDYKYVLGDYHVKLKRLASQFVPEYFN